MANSISNFFTDKIFPAAAPDNQTENGNLKTLLFSPPATGGEANAALNHITGQVVARQPSVSQTVIGKREGDEETQKTVVDFYKEILKQQPFDAENLAKKKVSVKLETGGKPAEQMSLSDYEMATDRAIFKQAGYGLLTDEEIQMAVGGIRSHGEINRGSDGLDKLRGIDNQPGAMVIPTDQATIEYAKRAGQAVLQYREYKAKRSDAKQEGNQSKTNQMLLDPLRLGGNVPFRWTERILNTPRDILQQIDKGEIMPGSSTAKWIGGKISEQITGEPAPQIPTISESVENLTGTKLPSIPEIEVPRPFEYQTEKYKREGKIGEDVGATALDLFLLKRAVFGKANATPQSLKELGGLPEIKSLSPHIGVTKEVIEDIKHTDKHLPNTKDSLRLIKKEGSAHIFKDRAAMENAAKEILKNGKFTGKVRGFERYGLLFKKPVGYRVSADGTRVPLYYVEMKIKGDLYHVIPRTKPSK